MNEQSEIFEELGDPDIIAPPQAMVSQKHRSENVAIRTPSTSVGAPEVVTTSSVFSANSLQQKPSRGESRKYPFCEKDAVIVDANHVSRRGNNGDKLGSDNVTRAKTSVKCPLMHRHAGEFFEAQQEITPLRVRRSRTPPAVPTKPYCTPSQTPPNLSSPTPAELCKCNVQLADDVTDLKAPVIALCEHEYVCAPEDSSEIQHASTVNISENNKESKIGYDIHLEEIYTSVGDINSRTRETIVYENNVAESIYSSIKNSRQSNGRVTRKLITGPAAKSFSENITYPLPPPSSTPVEGRADFDSALLPFKSSIFVSPALPAVVEGQTIQEGQPPRTPLPVEATDDKIVTRDVIPEETVSDAAISENAGVFLRDSASKGIVAAHDMNCKRRPCASSSRPVIVEEHRKAGALFKSRAQVEIPAEDSFLESGSADDATSGEDCSEGETHAQGEVSRISKETERSTDIMSNHNKSDGDNVNHWLSGFSGDMIPHFADVDVTCSDVSDCVDLNSLFFDNGVLENVNEQFENNFFGKIVSVMGTEKASVNNGVKHRDEVATSAALNESSVKRPLANGARIPPPPPPPPPPRGRKTDAAPAGSRRRNSEVMVKPIADVEEGKDEMDLESGQLQVQNVIEENKKPLPTQKSDIQKVTMANSDESETKAKLTELKCTDHTVTQLTTENIHTVGAEYQNDDEAEKFESSFYQNTIVEPRDVHKKDLRTPVTTNTEEAAALGAKLHAAVGRRDASSVARLLANGAHPDALDWEASGEPPLLRAAANGDIACVRALLAAGCDANARNALGETALHLAVRGRGGLSNDMESSGGIITLGAPTTNLVQELLAGGCDARLQCSLQGCSPLHILCRRGPWTQSDEGILRAVASVPGVVDLRDHRARTALHRLVEAGVTTLSLYQVLLTAGADASMQDARGETALVSALQRCGVGTANAGAMAQVVRLLAPHTDLANATAYGETALHIAARTDRHALLQVLLQEGASAEARDLAGNTALHLATARGFARAAAPLLAAAPAAVNAANADGCTPLHVAVDSGFIDVVKILLEVKECNLHARTQLGQTPLDLAQEEYRRRSTPKMALILLQALNRQDTTVSQ